MIGNHKGKMHDFVASVMSSAGQLNERPKEEENRRAEAPRTPEHGKASAYCAKDPGVPQMEEKLGDRRIA